MAFSLQARQGRLAISQVAQLNNHRVFARSLAISQRASQQGSDRPQAIKSTSDAQGTPANPSPPPRATASTPQPGSKSFQPSNPPKGGVARRNSKPPATGAPTSIFGKALQGVLSVMGLSPHRAAALGTTRDLYEECAAIWDLDRDFWQGGEPPRLLK